ncbi:Ubiquitin conjugating enzyme morgue [Paragonimus heterotremus]|uniref:E2 ubiquitin-conjugating enzyme n=1 Tax=Paragonimus heterotremus TaxID=100268 RepID=A0A8J4SUV2_9TREM|nr:Ubiquitin conjugating enzyme morgue [Paragonimus heterotremus]
MVEPMETSKPVVCKFCNGYYDFGSEQPVCSTCHAFLYEFCSASMTEGLMLDKKEASNDSGNEEPERGSDLYLPTDWYDATEFPDYPIQPNSVGAQHGMVLLPRSHSANSRSQVRLCPLRQQQQQLHAVSNPTTKSISGSLHNGQQVFPSLDDLPTEILLHIFRHLDDISLWTLRQVSPRCRQVVDEEISDQDWFEYVQLRWPLFTPHVRITSWRQLYLNLMESVACRFCLERLRLPALFPVEAPNLRYRRIVNEIRNLCTDPPFGIRVIALDKETYSHCLAGIEGPPQSPYQGGLFHVHVLVPDSYPIRPPVIRFLTRILHPNISFHGDVGMDCIQHNWSLALTLEKLLISVQSLLTDPYTMICMEPVIGALYTQDRARFEELAKLWTWKFACHDYLSADFVSAMMLPDYIEQIQRRLVC